MTVERPPFTARSATFSPVDPAPITTTSYVRLSAMALPTSPENCDGCCETVQEVLTADRAELTCTKETRHRDFPKELGHEPRVVVRRLEKLGTSPNAREQQRRCGALARQSGHLALQCSPEVF